MAELSFCDYQIALDAQSSCSLLGVVREFNSVMAHLWEEAGEQGKGIEWVNAHPICKLFAKQIAHLTDVNDQDLYAQAHSVCKHRATE